MKMKSLKTQFIGAIAMVLVAAIAMGSSTYAWFAMNNQVTATGMQVEVKSNNTFLLIGNNTEDLAAIKAQSAAEKITEALTVSDGTKVYPASPILPAYVSTTASTDNATHKYFASGTTVVSSYTTAAAETNWFTAQNNDPASANNTVKNVNKLNADDENAATVYDFSDYVIKKSARLALATGSDTAHLLTVTPTIAVKTTDPAQTADDITGVKVLVAVGSNAVVLDSSMNGNPQSLTPTADFNITDAAVTDVDIYIYYDGEESAVNTNNIADLAIATIELQFGVTIGSAA